MKSNWLLLLILFSASISGYGQTEMCRKSTEGKDFWFGFMESRNYQSGHFTEITLTSINACQFEIYIGKSTTPWQTGNIVPNTPLRIAIDWHLVEALGSEEVQEKAIHLVSDNPLNLYALNWCPNSSDVALIFPKESLGNEYFAICYTPHVNGNGITSGNGRNSEFLVVASEDNTEVKITPTKVTDKGKVANTTFAVLLNKGEVYQVQSENTPNSSSLGEGDLTGSYIKSNKPVALFSGSLSTTVPGDANVSAWDHLFEQIPPLQAWGRKFIAVPLKTREKDTYRILAAEDNTAIRVGSNAPIVLNKGQYHEFMLMYTQPALIESDKPILLAQYSNSNNVDKTFTGGDGDPFLVIVSPLNQTREKVAFVAYDSQQIINKYFINVIVKDDAVGKINLDGTPVSFQPLSGSGYSYAQVNISKGNHIIESMEPKKGFIAYVYGFGGVESYGYGVGYNLDIVLDLGSNLNADGNKLLVRCEGSEPLTLNAGNAFDSYLWNTGETTSTIQVTESGWYKVKASIKEGCELNDSVEILVSNPVVDLGTDRTVCNPETVVLDAGSGFANYLWSTSQTTQQVTISKSAEYKIEATNKFGCKAKDSINLTFVDKPKIDFSKLDTLICGQKAAFLNITSDKGSYTVKRLNDGFMFNGLNITVPNFGTYPLQIKATDEFSCSTDSVIKFGFHQTPTIDLSIDSTKCYGYNLDVQYMGNANIDASKFTWVFGGDTIKTGIGIDKYIVPLGINRAVRDLKLTVTDQGCSNEKTLMDIKVTPNLELQVSDTLGCEPFTTQFSAKNTETVNYNWEFGDGGTLNGIVSNPSHTYQNDGYYPVKLKITSDKGCTNEVKIDSIVYVAPIPTAGFTPFRADCLEKGNNEISYQGSGDTFDRYLWDLTAFESEEVIQNPNSGQGPFIFNLKNKPQANIGLNVISKYGCRSKKATVLAKRKPDFTLEASLNAGCTPLESSFVGQISDKIDQASFSWDFGDGGLATGNRVQHEYDLPDHKYNIVLTALSSVTGCSDTLNRQNLVQTYPKPKASFIIDNQIVYNDKPTVNFSNTSTGATVFTWDFGDGSTSDLLAPTHDYGVTGYQTVLLQAYNEFQCTDTTSQQLLVAFNRIFPPNAFSPNAPNPIDREFKLSSNGIASEGYHLIIVSRWNDIVFEARDEIKGWNGQMSNGTYAPTGTYVWNLSYNDFLGRKHQQKGTVTLVY